MSALASIALQRGSRVSGSDLKANAATARLARAGARIYFGHQAGQGEKADLVIYSTAVSPDNPELAAARRRGIPVRHRSDLLAELIREKKTVAVAGSHGKTSTAALIIRILSESGRHPSFALGGDLVEPEANGVWDEGEWLVAEADESDGSFRKYAPRWEVITGLDLDHVSYYSGWENLAASFRVFIGNLNPGGGIVVNGDDRRLRRLLPAGEKVLTYGWGEGADFRAESIRPADGGSEFILKRAGQKLGAVKLPLPGRHNILNCLAAAAFTLEAGVTFSELSRALKNFKGVRRRLEIKGRPSGVLVVEDYSHHPAEVEAALAALRPLTAGRLWCVFQPHRYSRLAHFAAGLARALLPADFILLAELYPAFEEPLPGVSSALLGRELEKLGRDDYLHPPRKEIVRVLGRELKPGDTVVMMGAGDLGELVEHLALASFGQSS